MTVEDLIGMSGYIETFFTNSAQTFRPDNGPYSMLLAELDANEGQEQWKEKISILLALAVLGNVPFSPSLEKVQSTRLMKIISEMMGSVQEKQRSSIYSRALLTLIKDGSSKACIQCGQPIEEGHFLCTGCHADYRPVCGSCGSRNSPIFQFCSNCGSRLE